jgi:hypothetical protein
MTHPCCWLQHDKACAYAIIGGPNLLGTLQTGDRHTLCKHRSAARSEERQRWYMCTLRKPACEIACRLLVSRWCWVPEDSPGTYKQGQQTRSNGKVQCRQKASTNYKRSIISRISHERNRSCRRHKLCNTLCPSANLYTESHKVAFTSGRDPVVASH